MSARITWPPAYRWMHDYALAKPEAVFEYKESWDAGLYRLYGKIFALLLRSKEYGVLLNLKCDPYTSLAFREQYRTVTPGWHMNKLHWVSLSLEGRTPEGACKELVNISYDLVKAGLPKALRDGL